MKKLLSLILVAILACTALVSCNAIEEKAPAADDTNTTVNTEANAEAVTPASALTYIGLKINPEVEMIADENGVIVSTNAVNPDGEVVLSETTLEGKTVEDAVASFTETAVDLGFMDPEKGTDTVYVDVNGENEEVKKTVEEKINGKLDKLFKDKNLEGKVEKQDLKDFKADAEAWNVSEGHAKLIKRVLDINPELTEEEILDLTVREILELLKADKHEDKISANVKEEYKNKVDEIKSEYKNLFELREAIEDIEDRLEDAEEGDDEEDALTAEEKAALEAELEEKKAELKALEDEYKSEVDKVKAEYKEHSKADREECRREADERKRAKEEGRDFDDRDDDDEDDDRDDRDDRDDEDDDDRDDKKPADEKPADKAESEKPSEKPEEKPENDEHKGDKPVEDKDVDDDDEDEDDEDEADEEDEDRGGKNPSEKPHHTENAPAETVTDIATEIATEVADSEIAA